MDLKLRPAYIGAIMGATNNRPPALTPAKGLYMSRDLEKISKFFDVPYKMPENIQEVMFVKGTLQAQRLLTSVAKRHPAYLQALSDELFMRIWSQDVDVSSVESLTQACKNAGLLEGCDELVASCKSQEVKDKLKETTQQALDYGAFGLPTYVAHLEDGPNVMFGSDRLFLLANCLQQKWPGSLKDVESKRLTV